MPHPLLQRIHGADIFTGFDIAPYPDDTQGWFSRHPVLQQAIETLRPGLVVEVGVWKGASTLFMAELLRQIGQGGCVIAVDTFLGSIEHWTSADADGRGSLRFHHGFPQLYFQFLANIIRHRLTDHVCPLPQTSAHACKFLAALGLRPQVIHIDGAHDYDSVARDLNDYFALLAPGGALIGDDFLTDWPEVVWAATEFARNNHLPLQHSKGKFVLQKPAAQS